MASLDDATEVLKSWGISPHGALEVVRPDRLFKVGQSTGDDLFLKDIGNCPPETLAFQFDVLQYLAASGLPVAVPLRSVQGHQAVSAHGTLFILIPSVVRRDAAPPSGWEDRVVSFGETIARLHLALATYPKEKVDGRTWFNDPLRETFDLYVPKLLQTLSGEQASQLASRVRGLEGEMQGALEGLPVQLIHRDLHDNHLPCSGDQVVGILECDHVSLGSPMIDLAYFLHHSIKWLQEGDGTMVNNQDGLNWWLSWVPRLLQAYDRVRPLSAKERASLPYMMIWVVLMLANWYIEHGHHAEGQLYGNLFVFAHEHRHRISNVALAA